MLKIGDTQKVKGENSTEKEILKVDVYSRSA